MWRKDLPVVRSAPLTRPPQPLYQFQADESSFSVPFFSRPPSATTIKEISPNIIKKPELSGQIITQPLHHSLPTKPSRRSAVRRRRPPLTPNFSHGPKHRNCSFSSNPQLLTPVSATIDLPTFPFPSPSPEITDRPSSSRHDKSETQLPRHSSFNQGRSECASGSVTPCVPPTPPRSESPTSLSPIPPGSLCKMTTFDGKNLGLVSTQKIEKGTLILKEAPFATIPVAHKDEDLTHQHIFPVYTTLNKAQRNLFRSLHRRTDENAHPDEIVNIVEINSIPLQPDCSSEVRFLGLFETISRLNHSCCPNAGWTWYENEQMLQITVSYIDDITCPTSERQHQLLWGHGFACLCSSCTRSLFQIAKSDKNLEMYHSIRNKWINLPLKHFAKRLSMALADLDLALDILKQEKKYDEFGEVYDQLFWVYVAHVKEMESKDMARRAFKHYSTIWGRDKALMQTKYGEFSEDPTLKDVWGVLGVEVEQAKVKKKKFYSSTLQ
ncbi:hypothetical protein V865_002179 [Kwoniella europaea PYCC6329]|uniref:SET domain-containing protein n=1 Tax=Kwoniella europaea PYCC6329 TaxID=1423913 RepID=A0AAX4KE99_9TREE